MSLITLFVPGSVILLRLPLVSSINPLLSSNFLILPGILTQVPRHTEVVDELARKICKDLSIPFVR